LPVDSVQQSAERRTLNLSKGRSVCACAVKQLGEKLVGSEVAQAGGVAGREDALPRFVRQRRVLGERLGRVGLCHFILLQVVERRK
jgi:hypothetical protein